MKKWELAYYLIEAKKNIDSIQFIDENYAKLANINRNKIINDKISSFYLNCSKVVDNAFSRSERNQLCKTDSIIEHIFYERDKNVAHVDDDYVKKTYVDNSDLITHLKKEICHVKDICKKSLPDILTLDFVPHDKQLFRLIHGINLENEEEINSKKYPLYSSEYLSEEFLYPLKPIYDGQETRFIGDESKSDYVSVVDNGINILEGIQNRQDFCITINLLYNLDLWMPFEEKKMQLYNSLRQNEILDDYGMIKKLNDNQISLLISVLKEVSSFE